MFPLTGNTKKVSQALGQSQSTPNQSLFSVLFSIKNTFSLDETQNLQKLRKRRNNTPWNFARMGNKARKILDVVQTLQEQFSAPSAPAQSRVLPYVLATLLFLAPGFNKEARAEGRTQTFNVVRNGIVTTRTNTDTNGLVTTSVLDEKQNQTITTPDGTVTTVTTSGDPRFGMAAPLQDLKITLPSTLEANITTTRTITGQTDPLTFATLTDTLNINGRTFTSVFTQATKTFTDTSAESRTTTTVVDAQGRITSSSIPEIFDTTFTYDPTRGRLKTITQGSRTSTIEYYGELGTDPADQKGFVKAVVDAENRRVEFTYDKVGRVKTQKLPDNRIISFNYDANGNVTSITPPGRPAHAFNYTPVDLEDEYTPPNIGLTEHRTFFEYNLDKQPTLITRPDKQGIRFNYESGGRLDTFEVLDDVTLQTPAVLSTTDFNYDPEGRLKTITAPGNEVLTFAYDGSLPLSTTWSGTVAGSVSRTYDNSFRINSRTATDSAGTPVSMVARFAYDNDDLLTSAQYDPDGIAANGDEITQTLTNNTANGLLSGTALGVVTDSYTYIESGQTSGFGEMLQYTATSNSNEVFKTVFERDKLGRITKKTETLNGTVTHVFDYTYDAAGRLSTVTKDSGTPTVYTYDANSNRQNNSAVYDDQDRLTATSTATYTYTDNGELLTKVDASGTTTYDYDVLGNLRQVTLPDSTVIEYVIDGRNRRVGKKIGGILQQQWLYKDQLNPIAELDGSGNVTKRFIYTSRANIPDFMIIPSGVNAGTYRIISDHLGSPRFVINTAGGNTVQELDYDEWGNVLVDTNPGFQPFGFAGGLYDQDTKLVRFGARDYDPETGRWTSKDPIGFRAEETNFFLYSFGDPVNLKDDIGLCPWCVGAVVGIGIDLFFQIVIEGRDLSEINICRVIVAGAIGAVGGQLSFWTKIGKEFKIGKNFRIAPFGNRTNHPYGRYPHYHRPRFDKKDQPKKGQGKKRHRPWEPKSNDKGFWDRF